MAQPWINQEQRQPRPAPRLAFRAMSAIVGKIHRLRAIQQRFISPNPVSLSWSERCSMAFDNRFTLWELIDFELEHGTRRTRLYKVRRRER